MCIRDSVCPLGLFDQLAQLQPAQLQFFQLVAQGLERAAGLGQLSWGQGAGEGVFQRSLFGVDGVHPLISLLQLFAPGAGQGGELLAPLGVGLALLGWCQPGCGGNIF